MDGPGQRRRSYRDVAAGNNQKSEMQEMREDAHVRRRSSLRNPRSGSYTHNTPGQIFRRRESNSNSHLRDKYVSFSDVSLSLPDSTSSLPVGGLESSISRVSTTPTDFDQTRRSLDISKQERDNGRKKSTEALFEEFQALQKSIPNPKKALQVANAVRQMREQMHKTQAQSTQSPYSVPLPLLPMIGIPPATNTITQAVEANLERNMKREVEGSGDPDYPPLPQLEPPSPAEVVAMRNNRRGKSRRATIAAAAALERKIKKSRSRSKPRGGTLRPDGLTTRSRSKPHSPLRKPKPPPLSTTPEPISTRSHARHPRLARKNQTRTKPQRSQSPNAKHLYRDKKLNDSPSSQATARSMTPNPRSSRRTPRSGLSTPKKKRRGSHSGVQNSSVASPTSDVATIPNSPPFFSPDVKPLTIQRGSGSRSGSGSQRGSGIRRNSHSSHASSRRGSVRLPGNLPLSFPDTPASGAAPSDPYPNGMSSGKRSSRESVKGRRTSSSLSLKNPAHVRANSAGSVASIDSARSSSRAAGSGDTESSDGSNDDEEHSLTREVMDLISQVGRPITPSAKGRKGRSDYDKVRAMWGEREKSKKAQNPKGDPFTHLLHQINVDPSLKAEITHLQAMLRVESKSERKLNREMKTLLEDRGRWLLSKSKQMVKVVVRVRPVPADQNTSSTPKEDTIEITSVSKNVDLSDSTTSHAFQYDRVYPMDCNNGLVYKTCARPLVASVFQKKKVSMFSYGATGSGKTHTMIGVPKDRGIFHRTVKDIYTILGFKEHKSLTADLSMFEVYGGNIHDLLNQRLKLKCRNDRKGNTKIVGLTHQVCGTMEEMLTAADKASQYRKVGSTSANDVSSRSHAIIRMRIIDLSKNKVQGMFQIIDLAGSERARDIGKVSRERQREGAEINKSLLALKECIRAMGKNSKKKKKKAGHVSFRSSVLTRILKSSLIGNTSTIMVACVGPKKSSMEPTINTLRYATQLKNMKAVVSHHVTQVQHEEEEDEAVVRVSPEVQKALDLIKEQKEMMVKEMALLEAQRQVMQDLDQSLKALNKPDVGALRELKDILSKKSKLLHALPRIKQEVSALAKKVG
ncbi:hypothetical protein AAMO2058_001437700 [Amorphochlora amoebiformis]